MIASSFGSDLVFHHTYPSSYIVASNYCKIVVIFGLAKKGETKMEETSMNYYVTHH